MSANPVYITQALSTIICCYEDCGIAFGVPERTVTELRRSHKGFYCPHGHVQSFQHESDVEKAQRLQREAEMRSSTVRIERDMAQDRQRQADLRNYNLRKRIKRGKCPVKGCKARFHDLGTHLKSHRSYKK